MYNLKKNLILVAMLTLTTQTANATEFFIEGAYNRLSGDGDIEGRNATLKMPFLSGIGGVHITDWLAVAGEVGFGVDEAEYNGETAKVGLTTGLEVRAYLGLTDNIKAYAFLGYQYFEFDLKTKTGEDISSGSLEGAKFGLAVVANVAPKHAVFARYQQYDFDSPADFDALSVGYSYTF